MTLDPDDLAVTPEPSDEAVAAIVAALEAHLDATRADADETGDDAGADWEGRRWAFAGRIEAVSGRSQRAPEGAPVDPWAAAGRADRF